MATVKAFIRSSAKSGKNAHIRFRLSDGRGVQLFHKSELSIKPGYWNPNKEEHRSCRYICDEERKLFNSKIAGRKELLLEVYNSVGKGIEDSDEFEKLIDKHLFPSKYDEFPKDFFGLFDLFLKKHKLSQVRINNYLVVKRVLMRFEIFREINLHSNFKLDVEKMAPDDILLFEDFLKNEYLIFDKHPEIYSIVPECRPPKPRGKNTVNDIMGKLRTFFIWLNDNNFTGNNPLKKFSIGEFVYGTPYYITIEERDKIMGLDLSKYPVLELHRDIFVFQCMVGCRRGDLWEMTHKNVVNGAIEYIARKTKESRPVTIRIPLNSKAKEILARHKGATKGRLFSFPPSQRYNLDIKTIFKIAGITRIVTYLNPTTGETEQRPINEIASSHLARRTFVGNLYNKVKDPELISALSGHVAGSKAFSRYRSIDDSIKEEMVQLIN